MFFQRNFCEIFLRKSLDFSTTNDATSRGSETVDNEVYPDGANSSSNVHPVYSAAALTTLKNEVDTFAAELKVLIDRDPAHFAPAVEKFLKNKNLFATNDSQLISGLINGFRNIKMHAKKGFRNVYSGIPVGPPAIQRRKSGYKGKKPGFIGRPPLSAASVTAEKLVNKANARAARKHSLSLAVGQNKNSIPSMCRKNK